MVRTWIGAGWPQGVLQGGRGVRLAAVAAGVLACAGAARAEDPKALVCDFSVGSAFAYEKGAFKPEAPGTIGFEISRIDADRQTATLTSPRGSAGLRVVRAVNALHFIEVVAEGFLNLTTVYDRDDAKAAHPAVHSRHFGLLGQPIVAQFQGFCTSK